jgi:hypothetical protein
MPLRLKRSLFLFVVGTVAWLESYFLAPYGLNRVLGALVITIVLTVGWMRTYWKT